MSTSFVDNSHEIKQILEQAVVAGLSAAAAEVKSQAARNTPVDTGQLKGAWAYVVDEDKLEAIIGNPLENAIWTEFGTGEYALENNGRQTPWRYQDAKGDWHTTAGKKPMRTLFNAFMSKEAAVVRIIERHISEALGGRTVSSGSSSGSFFQQALSGFTEGVKIGVKQNVEATINKSKTVKKVEAYKRRYNKIQKKLK